MLHAEPSRRTICTTQGVEQALVRYLIEHQEWAVPKFTPQFWEERFPGAKLTALQNILSKLSSDGAIIQAIAKTLPDELLLRRPDHGKVPAVVGESSNNATARFLPTRATLERYAREAGPAEADVFAWAIGEVSRIVKVLESSNDVRAMVRTNVPNEARKVVEQITDRLLPEVARRLNMTRQSVHAAVLTSMREFAPSLPLSSQDERLIERGAWRCLEKVARREIHSEFSALRVPTWPKIQL